MIKDDQAALSRRAFVGKVAGGAAGAAVVATVAGSSASAIAHHENPTEDASAKPGTAQPETTQASAETVSSGPPPWELLQPLRQGSQLADGWTVQDLTPVVDGSAVLTVENQRGRTSRLHICRNDGQPQGLVYTERLDLVVMNGGQGDLPTEESLGRAVAEVAHVLANNEKRQAEIVTALLPQDQRMAKFADTARLR